MYNKRVDNDFVILFYLLIAAVIVALAGETCFAKIKRAAHRLERAP